jgi:hypothetical protein
LSILGSMNQLARIKSLLAQSKELNRQATAQYHFASLASEDGRLNDSNNFSAEGNRLSNEAIELRKYAMELN